MFLYSQIQFKIAEDFLEQAKPAWQESCLLVRKLEKKRHINNMSLVNYETTSVVLLGIVNEIAPPCINQQTPFDYYVNANGVLLQLLKRAGFSEIFHKPNQECLEAQKTSRLWLLLLLVEAFLKRIGRCKRLLLVTGCRDKETFHLFPVSLLRFCGNGYTATKAVEPWRSVEFLPLPGPLFPGGNSTLAQ